MKKNNIKNNILLFSNANNEPDWIKEYRLNSYKKIDNYNHQSFGPEIKLDIDLNINLGNKAIPFEVEEDGFIACDIHTAFADYSNLVKDYFNTLISNEENRYTILNATIFESGFFIYVPPNKKINFPVLNKNVNCDFTRNIIIVDENAELNFIDYNGTASHFRCDCTEVFVKKGAKCRYLNLNLNTANSTVTSFKRAQVLENASMQWINYITGSNIYMGYPTTILKGENATSLSTTLASSTHSINVGAKMIHEARNTKSEIRSLSHIEGGGELEVRNMVKIKEEAGNSNSNINYEYKASNNNSKYDNVPTYIVANDSSNITFNVEDNPNLNVDVFDFIEKYFFKLSSENKKIIQNLINGAN